MANVLIVDDHAIVRAGYREYLASIVGITEIGEADTGEDALRAVKQGKWDVMLLDISLPGRSGMDILEHLKTNGLGVRVLVVSTLPEEHYALHVLRAGARGYLAKTSSPAEFVKAVQAILAGQIYFNSRVAGWSDSPHSRLSGREFQIFIKLAVGRPVSDIARQLGVHCKTISTYRLRILAKMSFRTNAQLTAYALKRGIIQSGPSPS